MATNLWEWINSDTGLLARILTGVVIFSAFAIWDIAKNGKNAQRWREYIFLLSAVALALGYGILNDQVTVSISWEYFLFGKGLADKIGYEIPPDFSILRLEAVKIGMKATWWVGLILGVAVLFANNPRRKCLRLPYRSLYSLLPLPILIATLWAVVLGLAGWFGAYDGFIQAEFMRPRHFACVWGIHIGGYIGGLLGGITTVWIIIRKRSAKACK